MLLTLLGQYDFVKDVLVCNKRPVDAPLVAMLYYGVRLHLIERCLVYYNIQQLRESDYYSYPYHHPLEERWQERHYTLYG